ncbi:BQ5605_C004g02838 [Microbotryum silenes-dioicae]|uniref:BQ5605_C004g02838 protein n=1 Tax=Microbotryum silenes-dioicae TaxID=796604 RepID=A0A2X0MDF6_9BASI|nr:BQ5605_C004g02838 [Microbotryum silenes-dioicae]
MVGYTTYKDLPYTSTSCKRQAFDLYLPSASTTKPSSSSGSPPPLCVFIHGGAWRTESKEQWAESLMPHIVRSLGIPAACLDYRLAPNDPHPAQILDVISGLTRLTSTTPLPGIETSEHLLWDRQRLILLGHSAGAFMIAEVLLSPPSSMPSDSSSESFVVDPSLRRAIKGAIFLDGIYDIPDLIREYPDYVDFVEMAFGKDPQVWAKESPAKWEIPSEQLGALRAKLLVLHSAQDELLNLVQPRLFVQALEKLGIEQGKQLEVDYETITGGHDEALKNNDSALLGTVKKWIARL